jgi:hypothetical protein
MRSLWRAKWDRWLAPEASPAEPSRPQDRRAAPSPVGTPAVTTSAPSRQVPLRHPRPARPDRGRADELEFWQRFFGPEELADLRGEGPRGTVRPRPAMYFAPPRRS